jgi:predicted secreted protein
MSSGSEHRGFVFAVIFIVIFGTLLASIPAGLQGPNEQPETVIPIDPSVLTGFEESKNYTATAYTGGPTLYYYDYDLGSRSWRAATDNDTMLTLAAKVTFLGILWFGGLDTCTFVAPSGLNRGTQLDFDEIDIDAEDGTVRYSLTFTDSGDSAGKLVVYWNETDYSSVTDAWDADEAYLIHGLGFQESTTTNIGALIVSLLFLQLPDVPVLVNVFIAVPIWACIVFVLWYIIKEMIPFV